jgi:hypothetical protein
MVYVRASYEKLKFNVNVMEEVLSFPHRGDKSWQDGQGYVT